MHRAYQAIWPQPFPNTLWVSPSGSDSTGVGTAGSPWRQVQTAVNALRAAKTYGWSQTYDVTINVRAGTYTPVTLGVADSGANGYRLRYVSYDGPGQAVLDAGVQITGWTNVAGSLFKATVPNTFWTMYENGKRANMCRLPKRVVDATYPLSRQPYFLSQSDTALLTRLKYAPGDFDPSTWTASDLEVSGYSGGPWQWFGDTNPVASIDTVGKFLNLVNEQKFNWFQFATASRYYVQGIKAMCTDPGEFYLDRGAGEVYYIARDGAIGSQVITIPTASEVLTVAGNSWADRVTNVSFDGFAGQNTDHVQWYRPGWSVPAPGVVNGGPIPTPPVSPLTAWITVMPQNKLGAFHLRNVDSVEVKNFHLKSVGMYGLFLDEYVKNCTFTGFLAEGCALAGVRAEGQFPSLGDVLRNNTFDNFKITNTGELSSQGGFQLFQSGNNHLSHFEIAGSPRQGIWVTGPNGAAASQVYCGNNLIDYGKLHNLCQDSIDVGALGFDSFSNFAINTANQLLISSIRSHPSAVGLGPVGVFCDDLTGDLTNGGQNLTNIQANTDMAGNGFRKNNSDGHALSNCSFLIDGSANPSFNAGAMDTANIGVTAGFPF